MAPVSEEKHCVRCHLAIDAGTFNAPQAQLTAWSASIKHFRAVPSLDGAGSRLRRDWVASFLLRPHDLRPRLEESMPRLSLSPEQAADIAAWLVPSETRWEGYLEDDAGLGRRVLEQKACGGCHSFSGVPPLPASAPPSTRDVPRALQLAPDLRFTRDRFQSGAIVQWLRDPASMRLGTLMPNLDLSEAEARAAAKYILTAPLEPLPAPSRPARLPVLERAVSFAEVSERVFRRTCWHCHAEPGYALGDGGPGNSGGMGFSPRHINLADYTGVNAGHLGHDGKRHSLFQPVEGGVPLLVAALLARQTEEAGGEVPGIKGMPLGLPSLPPEDIQLVETWVAQGRRR